MLCGLAFAQQPRIDSISPSQGPIAGGTIVVVAGAGFGGADVSLDHVTLAPLSRSDGEIRLQMPAHDNGIAVIRVGRVAAEFLYVPPKLQDLPPGYITTVAGIGSFTRDYGPATSAILTTPWSLEFDRDGNLYVPDAQAARVYRVRTDGTIETFAGSGFNGRGGDGGRATDAQLSYPRDTGIDADGNVYIGSNSCVLRRVGADGTITAVAGNGTCGFSGDGGPAAQARIGKPTYVSADATDVFFIDWNAMRIRRIHLADGIISTFAGNGIAGFSGDGGPATSASFNLINDDRGALALDPQGNLYLADDANNRIRRIDRQSGIITTFFAPASQGADSAGIIRSLTFDPLGNLYYAGSGRIVKVDGKGKFVTSWGNGSYALPIEGAPAATSGLGHDIGLAIDASGNILYSDDLYSDDAIGRVRRINVATGLLETVAGIGPQLLGENGPAIATLAGNGTEGTDLTISPTGELLLGDTGSGRIRRLDADGTLTTIGGTGGPIGSQADGTPATSTPIYPVGIEIDRNGNMDVTQRSTFLRIDSRGIITHPGQRDPNCGYDGDGGSFDQSHFCQAWDLIRDTDGNLIIADTNNNRVRRVDAKTNIVSVIAGNGGPVNGFERYGQGMSCGDGGPAVDACLNTPYGLVFDDTGDLFVSTVGGIRKIDPAGIISTFTLIPTTKLTFYRGCLYANAGGVSRFTSNGNRVVLTPGGTSSLIGDGGPAVSARVLTGGQADGIAIDSEGNIFVHDSGNRRIRAIRYGALLAPPGASIRATANGSTITMVVSDAAGNSAPSVRVDFAAPASGASCVLSSPFAITDANGVASVSCTSNCVPGTYSVTAAPLSVSSTAIVSFTNGSCRRRAVRH